MRVGGERLGDYRLVDCADRCEPRLRHLSRFRCGTYFESLVFHCLLKSVLDEESVARWQRQSRTTWSWKNSTNRAPIGVQFANKC